MCFARFLEWAWYMNHCPCKCKFLNNQSTFFHYQGIELKKHCVGKRRTQLLLLISYPQRTTNYFPWFRIPLRINYQRLLHCQMFMCGRNLSSNTNGMAIKPCALLKDQGAGRRWTSKVCDRLLCFCTVEVSSSKTFHFQTTELLCLSLSWKEAMNLCGNLWATRQSDECWCKKASRSRNNFC